MVSVKEDAECTDLTYMLQLPDRKTLEDFLLKQLGE